MPSSAPPAAGVDLDRIVTEDTPVWDTTPVACAGTACPTCVGEPSRSPVARRHPRYRALPPESAVLLEATNPRDADDATLPFVRQHTPAWEAAREGRITTGTLALALGLWCSESAMGALNLPRAGRQSRDAQREVLDAAVAVRPVESPNDRTAARARGASPRRTRTRRDSRETPGPPRLRRRDGGRLGGHRVGQC